MGKSRQISRRTVLRGIGTAIALPWLESIMPRLSQAAGGGPPRRMAFFAVPNGVHMPDWTPKGEGPLDALPPILAPLEPIKSNVTVLTGLALDGGRPHRDGPGDHARSAASFLTGAHPYKTSGKDIRNGVSVEQAAAEKVGRLTRFASLELGCERGAGGQLRFGLQLRLFVQHLLAHANLADEQRGQPAGRVRPPFRPGRADR